MTEYYNGSTLTIRDNLESVENGEPVNPDSVIIGIRHVNGNTSISDVSMANTGVTGEYEYNYTFDGVGTWEYTITAVSGTDVSVKRGLVLIV